jgi:hypothetical protein
MIFSVQRYCTRLGRLSHKRHGDGVDASPSLNDVMSSLASRGVSLIPLRVIATIGMEEKAGENKFYATR